MRSLIKTWFPGPVVDSFRVGCILFINLFVYRVILLLTPSANYSFLPFRDWPLAFLIGARFDLSAAAMGALLAFAVAFVSFFFSSRGRRFFAGVFVGLLFLYSTISITDWLFYRWISFRIDSRIFPFFTDTSLLKGGADDVPIPIMGVLGFYAFFTVLNLILLRKWRGFTFSDRGQSLSLRSLSIKIPATLVFLLLAILSLRGFRSHPLKASDYNFPGMDQVNTVSRSPFFEFASELNYYIKLNRGSKFKGVLPSAAVRKLRSFMGFSGEKASKNPLEHRLHKCFRRKYATGIDFPERPNLVIFQVESLSYGIYQKLRFLKGLAAGGISFDRFSAVGTVTFDGLWATLCSMLPTFGRMQTRYMKSNFQCVQDVLKKRNYTNFFFYGGNADMDSMRQFVETHRFNHLFEKFSVPPEDQKLPKCLDDDMLFTKALESMKGASEPFFYYILNSQTHPPGEVPVDFVWPPDVSEKSLFSYFDLALEKFFREAGREHFFRNTVFMILADHTQHSQSYSETDDRTLGSTLWEFRIPFIIYIPSLRLSTGEVINDFASQVDVPATVFDIMDLDINLRGWGSSVFCKDMHPEPTILFSRRLSYLTVIRGDKIYSSAYKNFNVNRVLSYNSEYPYMYPLRDITTGAGGTGVRDAMEFIYQVNRNIISNAYYWK